MSVLLKTLTARIRQRQYFRAAAYVISASLATLLLSGQFGEFAVSFRIRLALAVGIGVAFTLAIVWRRRWATRLRVAEHLDARYRVLENSTTLLARRPASLNTIETLQRDRVEGALSNLSDEQDLLAPFERKAPLAWAIGLSIVALIANLFVYVDRSTSVSSVPTPLPIEISQLQIEIRPPAYTGLTSRVADSLSPLIEEGAQLRFSAKIIGAPKTAAVAMPSGHYDLYRGDNALWQSQWFDAESGVYQVHVDGGALGIGQAGATHELRIRDDEPPVIVVARPDNRLTLLTPTDEKRDVVDHVLQFAIDVQDDYGIGEVALEVTRSAGTGEQVAFEEQRVVWTASDGTVGKTYQTERQVELSTLGLTPDGELYLTIVATDNRPMMGGEGRSSTFIVRWRDRSSGPELTIDNPVIQVMPEYFRSQRQIIIDSEALIAEAPNLQRETFNAKAQALANDQKALRLRYGRFLGEEQSGEPVAGIGHSTDDGHDEHHDDHDDDDHDDDEADDDHEDEAHDTKSQVVALGEGHYIGDGHDHGEAAQPLSAEDAFADAATAIGDYAHFHDQEEEATLFDPETRALLRAALAEMWQSEAALRQYEPTPALPHQYRALAFLKRVQNRSRVYARRVGVSITPPDPERRLTGELDDIEIEGRSRRLTGGPIPAGRIQSAFSNLLAGTPRTNQEDAALVSEWLSWHRDSGPSANEALSAIAALTEWQRDNDCADCREALRHFWTVSSPEVAPLPSRREQTIDLFGDSNG